MNDINHQSTETRDSGDIWKSVREQIDKLDNPEALLNFIHGIESQAESFYAIKGYAFDRVQSLSSNGRITNGSVLKIARALGYTGRQFAQYAELGRLVSAADSDIISVLVEETFWLDALRRKPSQDYLCFAVEQVTEGRKVGKTIRPATVRYLWDSTHTEFSPIIKPTDNWNFTRVAYQPVVDSKVGYIPGDIYANCFWYFAQPGQIVIDPMAGSGMAERVYLDRARWLGSESLDVELRMFDLQPLKPSIKKHDLLTGFPVEHADYIFIDPPYWGRCLHVYSEDPHDLANMELDQYLHSLHIIAGYCAGAQDSGNYCTILMGNYTDVNTAQVILFSENVREAWREAGYRLYHVAYASRHSQQTQSPGMANLNNIAKRKKTTLTDMIEILTFVRV